LEKEEEREDASSLNLERYHEQHHDADNGDPSHAHDDSSDGPTSHDDGPSSNDGRTHDDAPGSASPNCYQRLIPNITGSII